MQEGIHSPSPCSSSGKNSEELKSDQRVKPNEEILAIILGPLYVPSKPNWWVGAWPKPNP